VKVRKVLVMNDMIWYDVLMSLIAAMPVEPTTALEDKPAKVSGGR